MVVRVMGILIIGWRVVYRFGVGGRGDSYFIIRFRRGGRFGVVIL